MKTLWIDYKGKLIASSLLVLLPTLLAWLFLRCFFSYPLFLLVLHLGSLALTFRDGKNKKYPPKALGLVFWISPVISLFSSAIWHLVLSGDGEDFITVFLYFGFGLLFLLFGNYLPKVQPNQTVGIKMKWALEDEENWMATHRFSGKLWIAGGLLCMVCALFPDSIPVLILFVGIVLFMAFLPCLYSYWYYRRQLQTGSIQKSPINRKALLTTVLLILIAAALIVWVLFAGNMEMVYGTDSFSVETKYWTDLTIEYADVEKIQYFDRDPAIGTSDRRRNGFGNLRLGMGEFSNNIYGEYTRYTYGACNACVVLQTVEGETIVLNGPDVASTQTIYETLSAHLFG